MFLIEVHFILTDMTKEARAAAPAGSHLEGFVEPEHRAGRHVADPVQVPRDQVGLIQPAAKHIVRLVPYTRQQCVVICSVLRHVKEFENTHTLTLI